jgi:hypothetical protein
MQKHAAKDLLEEIFRDVPASRNSHEIAEDRAGGAVIETLELQLAHRHR